MMVTWGNMLQKDCSDGQIGHTDGHFGQTKKLVGHADRKVGQTERDKGWRVGLKREREKEVRPRVTHSEQHLSGSLSQQPRTE